MARPDEYRRQVKLMGSLFEFIVIAEDAERIIEEGIQEVKRIESLLTEFSPDSQTSLINKAAGLNTVQVDSEVYEIIGRCKQLSRLTQGAFDITSGILKKLYNFKEGMPSLPSSSEIKSALARVGYQKIELSENNCISLAAPGMHIGFGAIGKGLAADKVKKLFLERGVKSAVISASGDLTAWGRRVDGSPWKIGIANPYDTAEALAWLSVDNVSVATSGNYEQYIEIDGQRYSHNIDPKSGLPVKGIQSVTVVSPKAELSDALATAVTVMGVEVGLHFIDQLPDTHCLIVDEYNKVFTSRRIKMNEPAPLP